MARGRMDLLALVVLLALWALIAGIAQSPLLPAFYIRGHGLYTWGPTAEAAEHRVEACEFLLSCAWEECKLAGATR